MKATHILSAFALSILTTFFFVTGCSRDEPNSTAPPTLPEMTGFLTSQSQMHGDDPPSGLVDFDWKTDKLTFWPYTGNDFTSATQDPVSLIFVGRVDPVAIRSALMSLDGDRTAFDMPDVYPFNAKWTDAIGNVQTGYAEDSGWTGAVVQLALGAYEPMRFHLRLIDCGTPYGSNGCWTLGAAHFEITIPGTADHQVLAWELAEQIVVADFVRSGLLDPGTPPFQTDVINEFPSYHDIPEMIYNGIPDEIKIMCGLEPGPASSPVPIPTDGKATVLYVTGSVPTVTGTRTETLVMAYDQMIPKPFCAGPLDFVYLEGGIDIEKTVRVDVKGRYQYASSISGKLKVVPMDVQQTPPRPSGEPYFAIVSDEQRGILDGRFSRVTFDTKRISPGNRGTEKLMRWLQVSSNGQNLFRVRTQCRDRGK
ncbi:MAG: hypothetical protein JSW50_02015 [Candidatus Latescibacterota bacterium]|nr:MAG: hypothetical protein JSW50_02015 [Candidatus Latescibacterota bacterium]